MLTPRQPEGCVPVVVSRGARRLICHIVLDAQAHSQRQQRERNRECEGLQADCSEAGRTECSASNETCNNRPRVLCPPAGLGYVAGLTPRRSVAKIHDETGDVGCHHRCRGGAFQRKLHQRRLDGHRRNSQLAANKSTACVRIHGEGGGAAKRKKTGQQQELQKEQRDKAAHKERLQAGDQQPHETEHQNENWHRKHEFHIRLSPSYDVCRENNDVTGNMGVEKPKAEKTDDVGAAGDHAQDGREYRYGIKTETLRC